MNLLPGKRSPRILFVFVDGLGLAPDSDSNPVREILCPTLYRLLKSNSRPLDALLGVPGLPQSATGQTSLFTGCNAPAILGKHVEGFPGTALRRIIEKDNLFLRIARQGGKCRFANAYNCDTVAQVAARRHRSVTTTMALTCPTSLSTRADLAAGRAISHDLTRETRRADTPSIRPISPRRAAGQLARLAAENTLTLFEYFLTDRAGHERGGGSEKAVETLRTLDAFLSALIPCVYPLELLFILCSDHGNIEDMSLPQHTANPVPLVIYGPGKTRFRRHLHSLLDVTPALTELYE